MSKPSWCAKDKPCDYDTGSAYCLHRECRQQLEARFIEQGSRLDERTKKCEWLSPTAVDYDAWQTGCGQEFIFSSDGPLENSFKFCPYCGGEMTITDRLEGDDVPR